jgi:hypothetical protein
MVSALKSDQSLKTTIRVDAELCLPIWHCGTCEAFLLHVSSALDAIEKQGTFKAYKEAYKDFVEQRKAVKQAKAALALITAPTSDGEKDSKKASGKNRSEKEKASQKSKESAALANAPALKLHAEYQAWHMPVCTAHGATQCLRCTAALLVLQPKLPQWHSAGKRSVHRG